MVRQYGLEQAVAEQQAAIVGRNGGGATHASRRASTLARRAESTPRTSFR
jgi:hypothetical protein